MLRFLMPNWIKQWEFSISTNKFDYEALFYLSVPCQGSEFPGFPQRSEIESCGYNAMTSKSLLIYPVECFTLVVPMIKRKPASFWLAGS